MDRLFILIAIQMLSCLSLGAQPGPGDWYREYTWIMPNINGNENFLRVGGKFDYREQVPHWEEGHYDKGYILIPQQVELQGALKAEIMVEKNLCHDNTSGLSVSINGSPYVRFPEAEGIPEPQEAYIHHTFPVVKIPLDYLKKGAKNYFSLEVDSIQPWNWPQNLVYGLKLRVYYEPSGKKAPQIITPEGNLLKPEQDLEINYEHPEEIDKVHFIGHYYGPDMNGDGIYLDWHYGWLRGEMRYHIGTAKKCPFDYVWDTEWIPDQNEDIKVAALVVFKDGLTFFTDPAAFPGIERDYRVTFCRPDSVPQGWMTRNGKHSNRFTFEGDPEKIQAARIVWRSWSPGYMNGLYLNDMLIATREGERYAYHDHDRLIRDDFILSLIENGTNTFTTGMTPLIHGEMVHGTDVFYPGPMMLIKH